MFRSGRSVFYIGLLALALVRGRAVDSADLLPSRQLPPNPYDAQVSVKIAELQASSATVRSAAAEALGFLRAYSASAALTQALNDPSHAVRREAAIALGWVGGRREVGALIAALDDDDPVARQAAWTALTNITGQELPFDGQAVAETRRHQAAQWHTWWRQVADEVPPGDVVLYNSGLMGIPLCEASFGVGLNLVL